MPLFRRIYVYLGTPKNCGNSVYEGIELESKSVRKVSVKFMLTRWCCPSTFIEGFENLSCFLEASSPQAF